MFKKSKNLFIVIFWIAVWFLVALFLDNEIIIPGPYEVAICFSEKIITSDFWITLSFSLIRILLGFIVASVIGVVLAICSYKVKTINNLLMPLIQLMKSAPIVCFIVLLLVWFGTQYVDLITIVIAVIPVFYFAISEACKHRNINIVNMLKVYKVDRKTKWKVFEWPGIIPYFNQATKTGIGIAWKSAVTAQMIGIVAHTIGEGVYMSKLNLDSASLLVWMFSVVVLGWAIEKLFIYIITKFSDYWQKSVENYEINLKKYKYKLDKNFKIKLSNINKSYDNNNVLHNFNLEIKSGQRIAIYGPTGCGKTTIINIIMGLINPDSGNVEIDDYLPQTISCVFQEKTLLENLNIKQNIKIAANKADMPFCVDHKLFPEDLSGGLKRCAEIERAITADSQILIMDEPFVGLDAQTKSKAINYINDNLNGRALILITHDLSDAENLNCEKITID